MDGAGLFGKEPSMMPSCRFAAAAYNPLLGPHTPRTPMPVSCSEPGPGAQCINFPLPSPNTGSNNRTGPAVGLLPMNIPHQASSPTSIINLSALRCHQRPSRRSGSRSTYKHIPHREKPPHLVARRNARERRRVQAVNSAFTRLRRIVPYENKHKRLSKVKTLRIAIDYINKLRDMLQDYDKRMGKSGVMCTGHVPRGVMELSKENTVQWIPSPVSDDTSEESFFLDGYNQFQPA